MNFLSLFESSIQWIDEKISYILIPGLLCTGMLLTFRLGFLQLRRLWHGTMVTIGRYDKSGHSGDVSHFAALSTALSATVGVGNIAGVAMAIHYGGPGALFWMWVTAFLGMAVKYTECTLAVAHRDTIKSDHKSDGSVSGGPMYYMEKALGMKPLALFFASALLITSYFTGNAIQANTMAQALRVSFGIAPWMTGLVSAILVGLVILGGISRIGRISSILAPGMAFIYVAGALVVLALNWEGIVPALTMVVSQAFNPVASATGVGTSAVLGALTMGVKRGLFSNEAGQGSAAIAHAAARTDEPVSEGLVALLEPFIDTLVICTLTGMVLLTTGAWDDRFPTEVVVAQAEWQAESVEVTEGQIPERSAKYNHGWIDRLYVDAAQKQPFSGTVRTDATVGAVAIDAAGVRHETLYADAVSYGAPLTALAFQRGLAPLVDWGDLVVTISVVLFALSTAISWSYYGDRCAMYLIGTKAILPYRLGFCIMHFVGATVAVTSIWSLGDVALALATLPNILALVMLSGTVKKMTQSYFEREPWKS